MIKGECELKKGVDIECAGTVSVLNTELFMIVDTVLTFISNSTEREKEFVVKTFTKAVEKFALNPTDE